MIGPVFTRELVTAPRRPRFYLARAIYPGMLMLVLTTAWLVLAGTQVVRNVGDLARFGALAFQILGPLQLALAVFFAALAAASAVAQEKDRKTILLLLLSRLSNSELVLGKLLASLLQVFVLLAAGLPVFALLWLFGGVAGAQVARTFAVTAASALVAGSLGSTIACWRDKTFQALALTALALVAWFGWWEGVALGLWGESWGGLECRVWAAMFSPWQAVLSATRPYLETHPTLGPLASPVTAFLVAASGGAVLLNLVAIVGLRRWNPPREVQPAVEERPRESIWGAEHDLARSPGAGTSVATDSGEATAPRRAEPVAARGAPPSRRVWSNPILWREVRTAAYGRRALLIRLVYCALFAVAAYTLVRAEASPTALDRTTASLVLVPLFVLSLALVNAQAVTALTSERDAKALDLLLVTDLTPPEFVFGKLGGVFYNTKEMVLLPLGLTGYLAWTGTLSVENLVYLTGGLAVLYLFVAVLGIHSGMAYENTRQAVATSLGTVFFLFLGVATCLRMMVAFSGSFQVQLQPFLAFMLGGGIGLYAALGARNPSPAIGAASLICPFATFYAITSFLLGYTLAVFLVVAGTYGFATAAMLVPAIYEFDVATGRTTLGED